MFVLHLNCLLSISSRGKWNRGFLFCETVCVQIRVLCWKSLSWLDIVRRVEEKKGCVG